MRLSGHLASLVVAGTVFGACKESTTPATPVPTSITLNQTTVTLDALGATAQLTATVKDQNGQTMSGQSVTWNAANTGVATVSGTGLVTAVANGQTSVTATSGSLNASATVTVAQVVTQLAKTAGDGQSGQVGTQLAEALEVEGRDSRGNPVASGGTVNFSVTQGGGSVGAASAPLGANGRASVTWTLGTGAGAAHQVTATLAGASASASFSATATAGPASALVKVSGDNQTGAVGVALADSIVVRADDQFGNPVSGYQVDFSVTSGGGSVSPATVMTGTNGQAASRWTLGGTEGTQTAQAQGATAITGSPASFTATAVALTIATVAPDTIVEGAAATITGTGFSTTPANNIVTIGGATATVTTASTTSLTVTVPSYNCQPTRAVNVTVSTGGATSNTVSHPVRPASLLALAVGEQRMIRDPAQFCLQFAASAAGGDAYAIGVGATTEAPTATMPFTLTAVAGGSASAPALAPVTVRSSRTLPDRLQAEVQDLWAQQIRAESRLREWERRVLPTLGRPLPDLRAVGQRAPGGTRQAAAVGDTVVFRIPDIATNPCTSFKTVTTVVRAVGTAGIWHTDIENPTTDALTTAEIQGYSDTFDIHIYARDTLYFGSPSDIDANSRVEIVLSIEVNKFPLGVAGFVYGGDLFSRSVCASSDSSEVFYGQVPDPGNVAGTGARSKAGIKFQMPSLIAHEVSHNIQQSRRAVVLAGTTFMSIWESEGQAMVAQEVVGHSVLGNSTGQNYTSATAVQGQGNRWYGQGFDLLAAFYGKLSVGKAANAPELCSLFATVSTVTACDVFAFYGASWSFQRYVSDRFGPSYPGGEVQLHRDIVSKNPNVAGAANWEATLGMSLDTVQARWAGMLYGDDRVGGLAAALQMTSWNMFEIFNSFPNDDFRLVPLERSFASFSDSRSVRGGSNAYTRLSAAGARPALAVRVRDAADGTLGVGMKPVLWILRLQ